MPGRHHQLPAQRVATRLLTGSLSVAVAGAAAGVALLLAGPATATPTPNPSYHPGSDNATFTVTGVVDSNCTVSTGGTEVWIKPGDKINFDSALAGVNIAALPLPPLGKVAGLNVDALIDGKTSHPHAITLRNGKPQVLPGSALSAGTHTLKWTATAVTLVGGLVTLPLQSSELKSGASLSWAGVIHVTNDAAQCKLSVATPKVNLSVGPVKIPVPPLNVNVPVPNLPTLPGGGGSTPPGGGGGGGGGSTGGSGGHYTPPAATVPEQVMGGIGGGVVTNGGESTQLGTGLPDQSTTTTGSVGNPPPMPSGANSSQPSVPNLAGLTSNKAPAAQLPVLLAIIAIIALSLVTATYARLYLLRRNY